jgi:hypothetical protein
MPRTKHESILVTAPDVGTLTRFVQLLNTEDYWSASLIEGRQKIGGDYRPIQKEMRQFVQAWLASGPNVSKLINTNPRLNRAIEHFRPRFIPTKSGTARLAFLSPPEYSPHSKPVEIATGLFLPFLLNPLNEKLGGPCKHCSAYFVKKTKRQVAYCKKECGLKHTSLVANEKRRNEEHLEKLEQAKQASAEWLNTRTSKDWKPWVSGKTFISKNWLTRAVKRGELAKPVRPNLFLAKICP